MLDNQTIAKLEALGLSAMATALSEQLLAPGTYDELSFADRLGLLVDKEADARDSRRLAARLKAAKLRHPASIEDIDFRAPRGLDRSVILGLAQGPGSESTTTSWSAGRPGAARASWLVRSLIRPSAKGTPLCTRHAEAVGRPGPGPGRRPLRPYPGPAGPGSRLGPRRLFTFPGASGGMPRPARGGRGPDRTALDGGGQPAAGGQVAPVDGRSHLGRRRT